MGLSRVSCANSWVGISRRRSRRRRSRPAPTGPPSTTPSQISPIPTPTSSRTLLCRNEPAMPGAPSHSVLWASPPSREGLYSPNLLPVPAVECAVSPNTWGTGGRKIVRSSRASFPRRVCAYWGLPLPLLLFSGSPLTPHQYRFLRWYTLTRLPWPARLTARTTPLGLARTSSASRPYPRRHLFSRRTEVG